jgi:hypothetical protein
MRIHTIIRLLVLRIQNLLYWRHKSLTAEGKKPCVLCHEQFFPLSSYLDRKFDCNFVECDRSSKSKSSCWVQQIGLNNKHFRMDSIYGPWCSIAIQAYANHHIPGHIVACTWNIKRWFKLHWRLYCVCVCVCVFICVYEYAYGVIYKSKRNLVYNIVR